MKTEELSISGEWPDLCNKVIEKLVVQEYWYKGAIEEPANVIWLKVEGNWHRLYFDCGIIFWRVSQKEPNYSMPEPDEEYDYPLIDLTEKYELDGKQIKKCEGSAIPSGSQVTFTFDNNKRIIFKNINDSTSIET